MQELDGFEDFENSSNGEKTVNFGSGVEYLMNDREKSSSSSNINIDLGELDRLENELNELNNIPSKSAKNSQILITAKKSIFNFIDQVVNIDEGNYSVDKLYQKINSSFSALQSIDNSFICSFGVNNFSENIPQISCKIDKFITDRFEIEINGSILDTIFSKETTQVAVNGNEFKFRTSISYSNIEFGTDVNSPDKITIKYFNTANKVIFSESFIILKANVKKYTL
jgi:hypothetical protein